MPTLAEKRIQTHSKAALALANYDIDGFMEDRLTTAQDMITDLLVFIAIEGDGDPSIDDAIRLASDHARFETDPAHDTEAV